MRIFAMFLLYFLATLFPGFLCSHVLRLIWWGENDSLVIIIVGSAFIIFPYILLSLILIFFAWLGVFQMRKPETYSMLFEQSKRLLYGALFLYFVWGTLSTSNTIVRDSPGDEGIYWANLCGAWMMGYFSGLVLLMTYVIRKLRAYNKTADLT